MLSYDYLYFFETGYDFSFPISKFIYLNSLFPFISQTMTYQLKIFFFFLGKTALSVTDFFKKPISLVSFIYALIFIILFPLLSLGFVLFLIPLGRKLGYLRFYFLR